MRSIILTKLKLLCVYFSLTACFVHRSIQSSSFLTSFFHILMLTELYHMHIKNVEHKAIKRFLVKSPDFRQIFYRCLFFTNCYQGRGANMGMFVTHAETHCSIMKQLLPDFHDSNILLIFLYVFHS